MVTIKVTEEQARLIQKSLDFYSRVGAGQFNEILDHPTFDKNLTERFTIQKELEVGDKCMQGEIAEINGDDIKLVGRFGGDKKEQILKKDKVYHSPDWSKLHEHEDNIKRELKLISLDMHMDIPISSGSSLGIHNKGVDDTCRQAFDLLQVIRHEFYKKYDGESHTVGSSVHFTSTEGEPNKVEVSIE